MDISVVVPLFNEAESLEELTQWVTEVCKKNNLTVEIIFVDDGSNDRSWEIIESLTEAHEQIKGIKFRRNYGKSAALNEGFSEVSGDVIITMDADLQDSPEEIPGLYRMITEDGYQLVSGWKKRRHDPLNKKVPSRFFNRFTRMMSGIHLHDFNCGLKAYDKNVVKTIEVYGEMHRYIPVIAKWNGFDKIGEKQVQHQPRKYGTTKFGMERFMKGFLDLLSIMFVSKFGKRPMHLFGTMGTALFIIGFGIAFYLTYLKVALDVYNMTERPLFYLGVLSMIIGAQLFMTGFIAEMISRSDSDRNRYSVEQRSGFKHKKVKSKN
ncbi:MAG: glycosyltransferase [Bacteroidales bacterium]|nr:glycosyltransferase [Bacteroidales bacterium]MCF8333027.1 glycosyltransferase [Bacteroidales bacterium]